MCEGQSRRQVEPSFSQASVACNITLTLNIWEFPRLRAQMWEDGGEINNIAKYDHL